MSAFTTSQAQPTTPDVSLSTLRQLVAQLRAEHPHMGARADHAAFIALFRTVERGGAPDHYWVDSETADGQQYLVRLPAGEPPTCLCQDFARRGSETICKHVGAALLSQRLERAEAEAAEPLPETVEVDGVDVTGAPIAFEVTERGWAVIRPSCVRCGQPTTGTALQGECSRCVEASLFGE